MIGSHADIRPHHYRMARTQSYSMREATLVSFKGRRAWGHKLLNVLGWAFLIGLIVFCLAVR